MEHMVTEITPKDRKRSLVRLADGAALPLYLGEIRRYHIEEGQPIAEEAWEALQKTLIKRVRLRALHLLDKSDRTSGELREKLTQAGYPAYLADNAVDYVSSYGYVNDVRYARTYIEQKSGKKSTREMRQYLAGKHISRDIIDEALAETETDDATALRRLAARKAAQIKPQDAAGWQKVVRYLAGHGYVYGDIRDVIEELKEEMETEEE